uniref:Mediator complex subunit 30 n=1 Tax=Panagrellus redivivus TaxID=6233 RepID=A0A7E4VMB0_PANRE
MAILQAMIHVHKNRSRQIWWEGCAPFLQLGLHVSIMHSFLVLSGVPLMVQKTDISGVQHGRRSMQHHKFSLGSNDQPPLRARGIFGGRSTSPAAASNGSSATCHTAYAASPAPAGSSPVAAVNGHTAPSRTTSTSGGVGIWSLSAVENPVNCDIAPSQHICCHHHQTCSAQQVPLPMTMLNGSHHSPQTIEDQIRSVDKMLKDCDNSRKNLEQISRRLDDLNDEVKRYREFLGHEKSRRDPTFYKTMASEQPSPYNDQICGIMSTLTYQLTKEWQDKLGSISNNMTQTPSTPGSKMSDKN